MGTVVGPQLLSLQISPSPGAKAAAELELKSMVIRKENNWNCFNCKLITFICRYYGSGYPGQQQCGVDGRGFPFVFWPVVFTAPAIGGGASYLYREAEVLIFRLLRTTASDNPISTADRIISRDLDQYSSKQHFTQTLLNSALSQIPQQPRTSTMLSQEAVR